MRSSGKTWSGTAAKTMSWPKQDERRRQAEAAKAKFAAINKFVTERGGWITSIPGKSVVTLEALEGSDLPQQLRDYWDCFPREIGKRQRIVAHATTETILKPGSQKEAARTLSHPGLLTVIIYAFEL